MNPDTIGGPELSAWLVTSGVTWVQPRLPLFARKLSQRNDSRLVARGVIDGNLLIFEFQHGLAWARRLITRYQTKNEMPANARNNSSDSTVECRKAKTV